MALSDDISAILEEFGTSLKDDLQQSLRDKGVMFGSGDSRLSAKTRFEIIQKNSSIVFRLIMPDYAEYVDKGRGAGPVSEKGRENIASWAKRKGIVGKFQNSTLQARLDKQAKNKSNRKKKVLKKYSFEKSLKSLTYLVSRKLGKKGFEGTHFYSEVSNDGRIEELKKKLAAVLKTNVEIEIKNIANE